MESPVGVFHAVENAGRGEDVEARVDHRHLFGRNLHQFNRPELRPLHQLCLLAKLPAGEHVDLDAASGAFLDAFLHG